MANPIVHHLFRALRRRIGALYLVPAALILMAVAAAPAAAQTPNLVTNPDGSVGYLTPLNGSVPVNSPSGGSYYVTGNGTSQLITNPNGSVSYANVNGAPSLVAGPDGSFSYQYVIAGTNSWGGTSLGYVTPNGSGAPLTAGSTVVSQPLSSLMTVGAAPIPARGPQVSGRYCDLADGGQVWIAVGAPTDGASCQ